MAVISRPVTFSLEAELLVDSEIKKRIARIASEPCLYGEDNPFFVADLGQVIRQHEQWKKELRNVRPFYAVKCNNDNVLLKLLAYLGTGFDCASIKELRQVLSLGVDPSRIVFANPCKSIPSLVFANESGVRKTTFDNLDELDKIKKFMPKAQLLLRIYANDNAALISFGRKFGAPIESTGTLLARACELGLEVVGVSFHVGTGAADPAALEAALRNARDVLAKACEYGFQANLLDVGGGFQDSNFTVMSSIIRRIVKFEFPPNTRVIAEPGRYFARTPYTLVAKVIARRQSPSQSTEPAMLYQNDGIFGNFMNVIFEKEHMAPALIPNPQPTLFSGSRKFFDHEYSIWGPTCDSSDCVSQKTTFFSEVVIGDWLKYKDMGAYTRTTSSQFNGFTNQHQVVYVCSELGFLSASSDLDAGISQVDCKPTLDAGIPPAWFWTIYSKLKSYTWRTA